MALCSVCMRMCLITSNHVTVFLRNIATTALLYLVQYKRMEVDEAGAGVSGATLAADLQELEGNSIILLKFITEKNFLSEDSEGGLLAQAVAEMSKHEIINAFSVNKVNKQPFFI